MINAQPNNYTDVSPEMDVMAHAQAVINESTPDGHLNDSMVDLMIA
jgi:hypothetical protein